MTPIGEMCAVLESRYIKSSEYTDCTILYEVTFDQLRSLYDADNAEHKQLRITITEQAARIQQLEDALRESSDVLCNCEEAFEETRDFPLTLKDVREAVSKINELIGE